MAAMYTTLTRKGQITIPAAVRRLWGLQGGDRLAISLSESTQELVVRPVRSVVAGTFGTAPAIGSVDMDSLRSEFESGAGVTSAEEGLTASLQ